MKRTLFIAFAVYSLMACNKKSTTDDISVLNGIFISHQSAKQVFILNASTGGSIQGSGGSRYILPPNALVTQNGSAVTGNIDVELIECLKPADMIFTKVLPVSNGQPLLSGGEYKITFKQNGADLRFAPGKTGQMNLPQFGLNNPNMEIFIGAAAKEDKAINTVNWNQANMDSLNNFITYNGDTITLFNDSANTWCNADRFMTSPNYKSFHITINGVEVKDGNTYAYAVYDNYNGAWPMHPSGNTFSESHVPDIPVHFVLFGVYDGKFMSGSLGATPADNATYTVSMQETTPQALKSLINSF